MGLVGLALAAQPSLICAATEAKGMATQPPAAEEAFLTAGQDKRLTEVRHLDLHYTWRGFETKEQWEAWAQHLREQILVGTGLWPPPEKCPLNARIFERLERDGYSVEKVYFESYPGFFVTGNLYRPLGKKGPFPGILNPHGHWEKGRLNDTELGSVPGRCLSFARQGYVAFSYDMVGYNDSKQVDHRFGGQREELWGISPLALQLWNSIRAVDFLQALPDVDPNRLACTGASGGGTQTFMVTAVEPRIKVAAPVNMISAYMQGGCKCENAPLIRLDTNNMEIGALAAPRPLLMVSATGDWTKNTPDEEFPAIRSIYRLYGADDPVECVRFDAPHNYNKDSREAVYRFFGKWLLGDHEPSHFVEQPFQVEKPEDLLVFSRTELPKHAVTQQQLIDNLIAASQHQLRAAKPSSQAALRRFRSRYGLGLARCLAAEQPQPGQVAQVVPADVRHKGWLAQRLVLGRPGQGDRVPAVLFLRTSLKHKGVATLVVHPDGKAALCNQETLEPGSLVRRLLDKGRAVLLIDCFLTGESQAPPSRADQIGNINFFTTYNRTEAANRVQDILTALAYLAARPEVSRVNLVGLEQAGLWALLARGLAKDVNATVVDAGRFDNTKDESFLHDPFVPCLRRVGDLRTAGALTAPRPLLIHNTGGSFDASFIRDVYRAVNAKDRLLVKQAQASEDELVAWLTAQR